MISGVSLSGLRSFSQKLSSSANNTANVNTDGYKKTRVTMENVAPEGVKAKTEKINTPGPLAYEQTPKGEELIEKSNVELTEEIPNAMMAKRSYEANVKMIKIEDEMLGSLLDIKS
jgi:flagellar hook protein FlgE